MYWEVFGSSLAGPLLTIFLSLILYQSHPCYSKITPAHEGRLFHIQDTLNILNVLVFYSVLILLFVRLLFSIFISGLIRLLLRLFHFFFFYQNVAIHASFLQFQICYYFPYILYLVSLIFYPFILLPNFALIATTSFFLFYIVTPVLHSPSCDCSTLSPVAVLSCYLWLFYPATCNIDYFIHTPILTIIRIFTIHLPYFVC